MKLIEIAYILATMISLGAGIPQIRQLMAEKRSDEFNISSWSMWVGTQCVSLLYAISIANFLLVSVNVLWVAFYATMAVLVIKYRPRPQAILPVQSMISSEQPMPSTVIKS
jgi:uncharacterized protein with PQ loop repeat